MEQFDAQGFPRRIYELLVLGSLQGGPKHGYQIALDVEERSGGLFVLKHGTLYPILHRLERDGLIGGEWSGSRGERRKRVYALRPAGRSELAEGWGWVHRVLRRLSGVLEGEDARSGTSG